MNEQVEEILRGSYDMQVHAAPDGRRQRRMDALEVARCAYEAEMGGFALQAHDHNTAPLTYALNRMYPGLQVFGAITLNRAVGGINPAAVQAAADLGAQIVCMPTHSTDGSCQEICITYDNGNLPPGVHEILEIVAHHDMTLVSGGISPDEVIALFTAARSRGVRRMLATHPAPYDPTSTATHLRTMALGAYLGYTFLPCMPSYGHTPPQALAQAIRTLGANNCVVSTAFGQWQNPPPAEGMRMAIAALLHAGLSPDEVTMLVKTNPAALLGAETPAAD